jgi:hypothetical protein
MTVLITIYIHGSEFQHLEAFAIQTNSVVNWFGMQKAIGWDGITFPGIGLSVDDVNQWSEPTTEEEAFLKATEYDEFIDDLSLLLSEIPATIYSASINKKEDKKNKKKILQKVLEIYY